MNGGKKGDILVAGGSGWLPAKTCAPWLFLGLHVMK